MLLNRSASIGGRRSRLTPQKAPSLPLIGIKVSAHRKWSVASLKSLQLPHNQIETRWISLIWSESLHCCPSFHAQPTEPCAIRLPCHRSWRICSSKIITIEQSVILKYGIGPLMLYDVSIRTLSIQYVAYLRSRATKSRAPEQDEGYNRDCCTYPCSSLEYHDASLWNFVLLPWFVLTLDLMPQKNQR
jgi:hypothetical protein